MKKNIFKLILVIGLLLPLQGRSEADDSIDFLFKVDLKTMDSCKGAKGLSKTAIMSVIENAMNRKVAKALTEALQVVKTQEQGYGVTVNSKINSINYKKDEKGRLISTKVFFQIDVLFWGTVVKTHYRTLSVSVDIYEDYDDLKSPYAAGGFNCVCDIEISEEKDGDITITPRQWCVENNKISQEIAKGFAAEVGKGLVDGINQSNNEFQNLLEQGFSKKEARDILKEQNQQEAR